MYTCVESLVIAPVTIPTNAIQFVVSVCPIVLHVHVHHKNLLWLK